MIQLRIFTQSDPEPTVLTFAESEQPQIQLELADGTRIRLAHFAEGRFNGFDVGAAASSGPLVDLSGLLVAFIGAISVLTLGNVFQQGHDRHR